MLRKSAVKAACVMFGCTLVAFIQGAARPDQRMGPKNVNELLTALGRAAAGLQDYEVKGTTDSNGKSEGFTKYYKRPGLVRIDTREGQVSVQPNGDIRGRLGHGLFGHFSRKLDRDDHRLKDDQGIAFYEGSFPATIARIRTRIKSGAVAAMKGSRDKYYLTVRSGDTIWRYAFSRSHLMPLWSSRWVNGKSVDVTRYLETRTNIGLKTDLFRF